MRIGKLVAAAAAAATLTATFAVPAAADGPGTIVDIVIAESGAEGFDNNGRDYDLLREALIATDLAGAVATTPDITVFAPKDKAFLRLAWDLGFEGSGEAEAFAFLAAATGYVSAAEPGLLDDVLLYHVAPALVGSGDLANGPITTLQGGQITPDGLRLGDLDPNAKDAKVKTPFDIQASNGIIHSVSRVLRPVDLPPVVPELPASAVDVVLATSGGTDAGFDHDLKDYDLLREALVAAGLVETLAGLDDVVVFAPTDKAFVLLARDLGFHGWNEADAFAFLAAATGYVSPADPGLLDDVLLYHVGLGAGTVNDLQGHVDTLGGPVTIDGFTVIDGDPDDRDARIVKPRDIETQQGFVQTVNRVLRPIDL